MNLKWGVCTFLYVWSALNGTELTLLIMIMTNVNLHKNQNVQMNPISDSLNK